MGCLFFYINHTKPNYILVADKCQSNYVESNYNSITNTNRRKNDAGMVDKLSTVPFSLAIAIQVILAFMRIQAHQEGVMLGIHPHAVLPVVGILESIAHLITEVLHITPPVEKSVLLAEIVDHRIELCLEFVGVEIGTMFVPRIEESVVKGLI